MKFPSIVPSIVVLLALAFGCTPKGGEAAQNGTAPASRKIEHTVIPSSQLANYHRATFAGGCFWCEEAVFESINGVAEVISGYAGGTSEHPTYEEVGRGNTGHAESVEVYYDSALVDYPTLLKVYFASIDPTQVNGQGPDHGPEYRSIVFYKNSTEKAMVEARIAALAGSGKYASPIAVELMPFERFWKAEDYHQDYVVLHPENGYVQHESIPRLKRTQAQVKDKVKPGMLRI